MAFKFENLKVWQKAIEVVTCLYIGRKRSIINDKDFTKFYSESEELIKMMQGLRNSLK